MNSKTPSSKDDVLRSENTAKGDEHQQSNEVIDPYEISKNPYRLKGHSGILDPSQVAAHTDQNTSPRPSYPGDALTFKKMIDEHTAIYEVRGGIENAIPDSEIAVILADSDPPNAHRLWRVSVEGPIEAVNGFGATILVAAVRFEGYYVAPAQLTEQSKSIESPETLQPISSAVNTEGTIPQELLGTWTISQTLPVPGVSACDDSFTQKIVGTQIEFTSQLFRWQNNALNQPKVKKETLTSSALFDEYRTDFAQLGFPDASINRITIEHPDAMVTGATGEIPGDVVFLKTRDVMIFPICGAWFEAKLAKQPSGR